MQMSILAVIAEKIAEIWIEHSIQAIEKATKKIQFQKKLEKIIYEELLFSIKNIPNSETIFENIEISRFLNDSVVAREIEKFLHPTEEMSANLLIDRWKKLYGTGNIAYVKTIINSFIHSIRLRLLETEELRELIASKETLKGINNIQLILSEQTQHLNQSGSNAANPSNFNEYEIQWEETLTNSKALIESNRPNAALNLLDNTIEGIDDEKISIRFKGNLLNLIGNCNLALGKPEIAKDYHSRALSLEPENPDFLANAALTELHLENPDERKARILAKRSLEIKENGLARSTLTILEAGKRDFKGLDDLIDPSHFSEAAYVYSLAVIFLDNKNWGKAEAFIRKYLALKPSDIQANLLLSQILLKKYVPEKWSRAMERAIEGEVWLANTNEALLVIEKTLQLIEEGDNKSLYIEAKSTEAAIYIHNGELYKAKKILDALLLQYPENKLLLHNRIIVCVFLEEFTYSEELLNKLPKEYIQNTAFYSTATRIFIENNNIESAHKILDSVEKSVTNDPNYFILRAWAYKKSDDEAGQISVEEELKNVSTLSESDKLQTLASIDYIRDQKDKTIENLVKALKVIENEKDKKRVYLRLAQVSYENNNHENVIYWLKESKCDPSADPYILRIYIVSLYLAKDYIRANEYAQFTYKNELYDPLILEIESRIAEFLGNLNKCLEIEEVLLEKDKNCDSHLTQIARLYMRIGKHTKVQETLSRINFNDLDDPFLIMQCAEMYMLIGLVDKSLPLALKACMIGFDSPQIQIAYTNLFLGLDDKVDLEVKTIGANSAFLLNNNGESYWVKIIDLYEPNSRSNEYLPSNPNVKPFLGHKPGDLITLSQKSVETVQVTIKEIQSIYVRVFQEIYLDFSKRFPKDGSLQKMKFDPDNPTKILESVARLGVEQSTRLKIYDSGYLTFEQFSKIFSQNSFEATFLLQTDPSHRKFASIGDQHEKEIEKSALNAHSSITLTASGLLTLAKLRLLEKLLLVFEVIYIHQSIHDELFSLIDNRKRFLDKSRSTIGYHEGSFFFHEIPKDVINEDIEFLTYILEFIEQNCIIVPVNVKYSNLLLQPITQKSFLHHPGKNSLSAILIAKQKESILHSDEYRLRQIANEDFNVPGFWTQSLLTFLFDRGIINLKELVDSVIHLISHNYYYTYTNPNYVISKLEANDYIYNKETQILLSPIIDVNTSIESAINFSVEVIIYVWSLSISPSKKVNILNAVLWQLISKRQNDYVITIIIRKINAYLTLAPDVKQDLIYNILLFKKVRDQIVKKPFI